jgi:hypothetical protein
MAAQEGFKGLFLAGLNAIRTHNGCGSFGILSVHIRVLLEVFAGRI